MVTSDGQGYGRQNATVEAHKRIQWRDKDGRGKGQAYKRQQGRQLQATMLDVRWHQADGGR